MMQQTLIRSHKENHNIWKWLKMSHFWFFNFGFSDQFSVLSLSKTRQNWLFLAIKSTFVHSKCKSGSLRSQCWMRLFGWFSYTVNTPNEKEVCYHWKLSKIAQRNKGYLLVFRRFENYWSSAAQVLFTFAVFRTHVLFSLFRLLWCLLASDSVNQSLF